jgi:hypothetical protein
MRTTPATATPYNFILGFVNFNGLEGTGHAHPLSTIQKKKKKIPKGCRGFEHPKKLDLVLWPNIKVAQIKSAFQRHSTQFN